MAHKILTPPPSTLTLVSDEYDPITEQVVDKREDDAFWKVWLNSVSETVLENEERLDTLEATTVATGSFAYNTSVLLDTTITHGLGSDDIDITLAFKTDRIDLWSYIYGLDTGGYVHSFQHSTAFIGGYTVPSFPSTGDFIVRIGAPSSGTIIGNVKWTARIR